MRLVWTTSLPLFMVVALTMTTTFVNAFVVPTTTTTTNYYDNNNAARLLLSDEPKQQQPPQRLEPLFLAKKKKEEEEDTGDTIRKAEFVDSIVAKTGLSKKDANAALGAVLDTIEEVRVYFVCVCVRVQRIVRAFDACLQCCCMTLSF